MPEPLPTDRTLKKTVVIKSVIIVSEWAILRVTADLQRRTIATGTQDRGHHLDAAGQTHVIEITDVDLLLDTEGTVATVISVIDAVGADRQCGPPTIDVQEPQIAEM